MSREGRIGLAGAVAYCGTSGFTVESTGNSIVIALRSPARSTGGRFRCRLSVVEQCRCGIRNSVAVSKSLVMRTAELPPFELD